MKCAVIKQESRKIYDENIWYTVFTGMNRKRCRFLLWAVRAGHETEAEGKSMKAIRLHTEYLNDPMGIDLAHPRLMWNCEGGIKQTAYEIISEN